MTDQLLATNKCKEVKPGNPHKAKAQINQILYKIILKNSSILI
jgi:hypothetical protein